MIAPTFLMCSERSGSNLIRVILDAHSEIFAPMPLNFARDIWYRIYRYGDLQRDENWSALVRAMVRRFHGYPSELGFTITVDELLERVTERRFSSLYAYIYGKGLRVSGKKHLFLKENNVARHLWLYREAFPDARYVFQVRGPRDYLLSCRKVGRVDPIYRSDAACIQVWRHDQEAALNALYKLGPTRVFAQKYEDLVRDPEKVLRALCSFLGVEFEPGMLSYHERKAARLASTKFPEFWSNLSKPVARDRAGQYRRGLSGTAIRMIEFRVGPLMRQLGYDPDFAPPRKLQRLKIRSYEMYRRLRAALPPATKAAKRGTRMSAPDPLAPAEAGQSRVIPYPYHAEPAIRSAAG